MSAAASFVYLDELPVFTSLSEHEIATLSRRAVRRRFRGGSILQMEGQNSGFCAIVVSGSVQAVLFRPDGGTVHLDFYNARDCVGEFNIIEDSVPPHSLVVLEDSELLMFPAADIRNAGEAVMRGRPLLTIIPGETRLVTEIYIPNKDVGLLKADMPTRCKFDAFPFAEHGVLTGRLETIAPSAVRVEGSPAMYRAYSSLDQDYFLIKGTRVPLRPGMEATVEIVTDRKSILSILAQPLLKIGDPRDAESDGSVRQTFSKTSAPHATRSVVQNDRAERSDVQTAAGGVQ